jgi:predicted nucleic acid-binding protein
MSGFLLDTNIISELIKPRPEPKVVAWIEAADESLLYLSVLTLGEIRKRIASLPQTARRGQLEAWLANDLRSRFSGRILPVDEAVADCWGLLTGEASRNRIRLPVIDGLLAATALSHNLTLATRNAQDVAATGVPTLNPWEA